MLQNEERWRIVLRVLGSFMIALLVVALLAGAIQGLAGDGVSAPDVLLGLLLLARAIATPLLLLAGLGAFFFHDRVSRRPLLWGGAATMCGSMLCFLVLPAGLWIAGLIIAAIATAIFYFWMERRPLGTS